MADETPYQRDRRRQVEDLQNLPAFVRYLMGEHNYFSELDRKSSSRLFCVNVLDLERYGFSAEVLYSRILESVERPPYLVSRTHCISITSRIFMVDPMSLRLVNCPGTSTLTSRRLAILALLIAIDFGGMTNRHGPTIPKEFGIAVLDTRDIINSQKPLQDLIKTRNFCVGTWGRLRVISKRSFFGQTEVYGRPQFKNVLTETLT